MIGHNGGPAMGRSSGWVAIARTMRNHPIVGFHLFAKPCDPSRGAVQPALAFIDLIMECQYEDGFVVNGGRKMEIKSGQLIGAVSWLAARWNWTPKAVRIWLDKLEADCMISRHVPGATKQGKHQGKVATVITLCNYSQYQRPQDTQEQMEGQIKGKQGANEGQQYIDKQTNKGTIEEGSQKEATPPELHLEPEKPKEQSAPLASLRAFEAYNDLALRRGLPQASRMTPKRAKGIAARMREFGGMPGWERALANVDRSAFLQGTNDRNWRADLDWLIGPENFAKVHDGRYGNGAHSKPKESAADREMRGIVGDLWK